jgi:hypothetical protein
MTIVNDDSSVINKLGASLTDDTRVIIYDCHMFIVQATSLRFEGKVEEPTLRLDKVPHFTTVQNELLPQKVL